MKKEILFLSLLIGPLLSVSCDRQEDRPDIPVVIFDTDMGNDVDDALALRMLLRYDQEGRIDLKGVSICKNNPHSIEFVDAFCRFSGYGDLPLAFAYEGVTPDDNAFLVPSLSATYDGKPLMDVRRTLDSRLPEGYVALRQWLADAKDGSVQLIATGPLTNIANLLNSGPDRISELDGVGLVAKKVKSVHLMSGYFGEEKAEWNVLMDIPASQAVYEKCPVPLVTSGWEVGAAVRYPHGSILRDFGDPASDPLTVAYMAYMEMPYDRECWDLTTVLDAVESELGIFQHSEKGWIRVDGEGISRFFPDPEGLQTCLKVTNPDVAVSTLVQRVSGRDFPGEGMTLLSPDARTRMEVHCGETLSYTLFHHGREVLRTKPLSMTAGDECWGKEAVPVQVSHNCVRDAVLYQVPRKYAGTVNNYNVLSLDFGGYGVEFRAYDAGVAYRFVGKEDRTAPVDESGGYVFPEDFNTFTQLTGSLQNWFEENYTEAPLSGLDKSGYGIEPVLVQAGGTRVLLADANTYNYAGSYLRPSGNGFDLFFPKYPAREELVEGGNKMYAVSRCDYIVESGLNRVFPWRAVGVFDSDAALFEDDLIYLLSEKTEEDYSWIRPGKALWDWWNDRNITGVGFVSGINTETYMYLVDYAASHHLEYVLIDEGWSDAGDLLKLNPQTDIPAVCSHARDKGVGILLWAKWVNVDRQMEEAFRTLSDWGVKGIKIDFMDRNDARMVDFYTRVAEAASRYRLLVDFHGAYPNEGMRAKFPNLMTREGVIGLEYNKMQENRDTPRHELLIPFIRQWVGPMDFTPGSMLNAQPEYHRVIHAEPMSMGTRCHQLAMYVVYESPLQMVSDSPDKYDSSPECFSFIEQVPTVWDQTVVLSAELGRRISVARRSGDCWFLASMLAGEGEELDIPLNFLPEGTWKLTEWRDGVNASRNAKDWKKEERRVTCADHVHVRMENNGGWAAILKRQP